MRFYCAKCQAKYNVDDSQLPEGKILRLNCKKCNGLMRISKGRVIEGATMAGNSQATASAPAPQAAPTPAPQATSAPAPKPQRDRWYVLYGEDRQGPFTHAEVLDQYQKKIINQFTFVWHKGMTNWQQLHEVSDFTNDIIKADMASQAAANTESTAISPTPAPKIEALTPDNMPGDLSFAGFDALMDSAPEANMGRVLNQDGSAAPAIKPVPMPAAGSDYLEAPPGEATKIFFATAGIYKRRRNQKIAAIIISSVLLCLAAFIVADANGWIQLPGMGAIYEKTDMLDPNKERGIERIQVKLTRKDLTPEERAALRKKLHLYEEVDVSSLQQVDGQKKTAKKGRKGGRNNTSAGTATNNEYHEEFKQEAPANKGTEADLMASMFNDNRKKDTKVELNLNAKVSTTDLPAGLTQEAITTVIGDSKKSLILCTAEANKAGEKLSGRMEVEFTIQGTGKVSAARITTKKFKETKFAGCIIKTVQRWTFPRFNGEPVTVSYPIIITLGI